MGLSVGDKTVSEFTVGNTPVKQGADEGNLFRGKNKKTFSYTGSEQSFTVPADGYYILECWGAEGGKCNGDGNRRGGRGGYAKGKVYLTAGTVLKIYVGGQGKRGQNSAGRNGGGHGGHYAYGSTNDSGGGGGATDIRIGGNTLYHRLIVAGGGGGGNAAGDEFSYAYGGGESGGPSRSGDYGGKQTAAGGNASFGQGASNNGSVGNNYGWAGGGGGWYGGGSTTGTSDSWSNNFTAGGGSGFVWEGQDTVPSGYLVPEDYILDETENIAGNQSVPSKAGTGTTNGSEGDGYVVISFFYGSKSEKITQAGIYHNEELGLISMSADGENWITIDDKNAGAWSNDIEDELSYGGYFQFGNSHGFGELPEPTPGQRLPNEYQEVEYIESSGTQYISTNYTPIQNTEFEIEYEITSYNARYGVPMGTRYDHNVQAYYFGYENNDNSYYGFGNNKADPLSVAFHGVGVRRNITYHNNVLSNGTQSVTVSVNQQPAGTIRIFGEEQQGNVQELGCMKLYKFKLREGETLIRNFVPCYRKVDGVIGMYDLVNDQFYINAGTGTFAKGPNVYYDRHWQPGANTVLYMPLNGDLQDYSGSNNHGTWSGTSEYRDVDGKKYAYFNENSCIDLTSYPIGTGNPAAFTNSCVVKLNSSGQATMHHFGQDANNSRSKLITFYSDGRVLQDRYGASYDIYIGNAIPSSLYGTRVHIVYVYDGNGGHTIYLNGELYGTGSGALNVVGGYNKKVGSPSPSASAGYGLAEFIIENGMWTAEDVADYFNRVKSLYGIS